MGEAPQKENKAVLAIIALLPLVSAAQGLATLWAGEVWRTSKSSPPRLITGSAAYADGLFHIFLGLFVAAVLSPSFGASRRTAIALGAGAALGAVISAATSILS